MEIQKLEVCINEDIKIDNSVDTVEIVEKILDKRMIAMRRRMGRCGRIMR